MSFGFSIGDFVLLTNLAWKTVQNARSACGAHDDLTREVTSLHIVLQRLQREIAKPQSILNNDEDHRREELATLAEHCQRVLKVLSQILEKYNGLSEEKRKVVKLWKTVKFSNGEMQDLSKIRLEISAHTNAITMFLNLLSVGSQGIVEGMVRELQTSVNWIIATSQASSAASGRREGSILTSYTNDDKSFWRELRRELVKDGFSSSVIREHKASIQSYVTRLGSSGALDDLPPEINKAELQNKEASEDAIQARIEEEAVGVISERDDDEASRTHNTAARPSVKLSPPSTKSLGGSASDQSQEPEQLKEVASSHGPDVLKAAEDIPSRLQKNENETISIQEVGSTIQEDYTKSDSDHPIDDLGPRLGKAVDATSIRLEHIFLASSDGILHRIPRGSVDQLASEGIAPLTDEQAEILRASLPPQKTAMEEDVIDEDFLRGAHPNCEPSVPTKIGDVDFSLQDPQEEQPGANKPEEDSELERLRKELERYKMAAQRKKNERVRKREVELKILGERQRIRTGETEPKELQREGRTAQDKRGRMEETSATQDSTKRTITLFDCNVPLYNLGQQIFAWAVEHHGVETPIADMASELWSLLNSLYGNVGRCHECMPRIRSKDNREMIENYIESGERLTDKMQRLVEACETLILKTGQRPTLDTGGMEFVDTIFGRDRYLEDTEKVMAKIRLWRLLFDANCEEIVRKPHLDEGSNQAGAADEAEGKRRDAEFECEQEQMEKERKGSTYSTAKRARDKDWRKESGSKQSRAPFIFDSDESDEMSQLRRYRETTRNSTDNELRAREAWEELAQAAEKLTSDEERDQRLKANKDFAAQYMQAARRKADPELDFRPKPMRRAETFQDNGPAQDCPTMPATNPGGSNRSDEFEVIKKKKGKASSPLVRFFAGA